MGYLTGGCNLMTPEEDYEDDCERRPIMDDNTSKMLTEFLGECWHEWFVYEYQTFKCKKCGKWIKSYESDSHENRRTFDCEPDLMALYRSIYEVGKWSAFESYSMIKYDGEWIDYKQISWLFCLSGSGYEERAEMVSQWLEEGK